MRKVPMKKISSRTESTPGGLADQDTGAVGDAQQLAGNDGKRGADLVQMGLQTSGLI